MTQELAFPGTDDTRTVVEVSDYIKAQNSPAEPVAWQGAEEWESLAWELCADENGEDACNELIWEGGPVPEPWGDRWLKYEGEAKRLIALVRKHVAAPQAQPTLRHCACEFDGDTCVTQCKLHGAHVDAIHEWAERAKAAEAKLAAPQQAVPKPLAEEQIARLRDALAQALGDTYVCNRVWEAWHVGTMSEDDFEPADQCQELLDGLIDAVCGIGEAKP